MKKEDNSVNMYDYSFPVIGGKQDENLEFEVLNIIGTCFYIGGKTFLTAGHVLTQLMGYERKGIGKQGKKNEDNEFTLELIEISEFQEDSDFEIINKKDLGIFKVDFDPDNAFQWSFDNFYPPETFQTFGYAFALNLTSNEVVIRSILGHIVAIRNFREELMSTKVYELSAICPRGISGAFLLSSNFQIVGLIFGNSASEIEIYYEEVLEDDGKLKIIDRKTEVMKYGVAVTAKEILLSESKLLGKTIHEFLNQHKLIDHEN